LKSFKRHISLFEKFALAALCLLLLLMIAGQLCYGGGSVGFMIFLAVCIVSLLFLLLIPLRYELHEDCLIIVNPSPLKSKTVKYSQIVKFDTVGSNVAAKIDADAKEVLIVCSFEGKRFKKVVSCHPKNVCSFVEELEKATAKNNKK